MADIHFTSRDWERIERDYTAWWNHDLGRPLVQIQGYEPDPTVVYPQLPERLAGYPLDMPAEEVIARAAPHLESQRFYGDALPRFWVDFGPGIMAGFMGALVHPVPETVWFEPAQLLPANELELAYSEESVWWRRVVDITQEALTAWQGQVQIGHTDLGGNLDILASFRTTEGLLMELYDAPGDVERLMGGITAAWIRYYDALYDLIRPVCAGSSPWATIWSPGKCYMLQCDFSYMISPAMFERFVMPDLTACCEHLDHGFYHMDGPGELAHLDLLLSIERLRGIQWIPGAGNPEPDAWPDILKRIIDGGKLCQLYVSAEGARNIVRNLGGKGFLLTISDRMTAGEAEAFIEELRLLEATRG